MSWTKQKKLLGSLSLLCVMITNAAWATPDSHIIQVQKGTHKLLREHIKISRLAVGDPNIADVTVIKNQDILITGKKRGVTSLMVFGANTNSPQQYQVVVGAVHNPLEGSVVPGESQSKLRVGPSGALLGVSESLREHDLARQAQASQQQGKGPSAPDASQLDMDTEVQTDIKVVEISRTTMKQFGINVVKNIANTTVAVSPPGALSGVGNNSGSSIGSGVGLSSASGFLPVQNAFQIVIGDSQKGILGLLSVLESQGLARTLAEPSLTAQSGHTASFLAGGEFPVPVEQGSSGGASGITVQYKQYGIRVSLTPTVISPNQINLKVAPEVSDLDYTNAVSTGGVQVPSLTVRRTDTTVELGNGQSFVISGLISHNFTANADKIPFLGSVPILGAFFKSTNFNRTDKELIMVVTPHLVRPLAAGSKKPKLPGSRYDHYNPSSANLIFEENGQFKTDTGFSR